MKKIITLGLAVVMMLAFASTCFAYVMNGQGACSRCGCSGFYPQANGYQNQCTCGHWQSDHSR